MVKLGYGRTSTTWLCKDSKYVSSEASGQNRQLTFNRSAYKVLKVGAANATRREKTTFERIGVTVAKSEHPGSICVRQPERIFEIGLKGHTYNCFVFEPLVSNLLEYTNRPSNRPFGSQNVRFTAIYLLHAIDFLHTNGIAHTGKLSVTSLCPFFDNVQIDIKLDNIQLTLPDEQDSYLDTFCATEKSTPSSSKLGKGDTPGFASREMQQGQLGYPILCDLGSALFDEVRYSAIVQALPYRAPEVILGAAWDHKIDVWNFGVLVSKEVIKSSEIH
jgi:serine/threonine-protein kinase SRPK3